MAGLIPWRSRGEVDRFRSEIDRMFDDFFTWSPFSRSYGVEEWMPAVDMSETAKEIIVNAEVPGIDANNIDITIKGERKQDQEEKGENYHRIERRYGSFSRSLELPADVNGDKVTATYKDGVLKVNLPKAKEQSVKKIEVKAS